MSDFIFDREIERHFLSLVIQYPDVYFEFDKAISENDFFVDESCLHQVIFQTAKTCIIKDEGVEPVVLATKIRNQGISFKDGVDVFEYIRALKARKVRKEDALKIFKELKAVTVRRIILDSLRKAAKYVKRPESEDSVSDIITKTDKLLSETLGSFDSDIDKPISIFSGILNLIEDIADDPSKYDLKIDCPYERVGEVFGSWLRAGHITVIVSRTGVGKTTLTMDYCLKSSKKTGIPVLHLDNGEMSSHELMLRQAAARTGVAMNLFEDGEWRKLPKDKVDQIRKAIKESESMQYDYYNIAGMTVDQMKSIVKKYYYSKVGRGKKMILLFDYIKPPKGGAGMSEWAAVGEIVDGFKQLIHKDITFDNKPVISMITSVQANRSGTVGQKKSEEIIDDESIVSLSDRISHYCSYLIVLRKKAIDELIRDGNQRGTHKAIPWKARALGKFKQRYLQPVKMPDDSLEKYYVNFDFSDFDVQEKGDLQDISDELQLTRRVIKKDGKNESDSALP